MTTSDELAALELTEEELRAAAQLSPMLRRPGHFVERRVDHLFDLSSQCMEWRVDVQLLLPDLPPSLAGKMVVSLGIFKKARLPDLRAHDAAGSAVPLLSRQDRTRLLTGLVGQPIRAQLSHRTTNERSALARELATVVAGNALVAATAYVRYSNDFREHAITRVLRSPLEAVVFAAAVERHLAFVSSLVERTHILAVVEGEPGQRLMISYTYSELHNALERPKRTSIPETAFKRWATFLLTQLGLIAVQFRLKPGGANHAHSYYLLASAPEGTEVDSLYWFSARPRASSPPQSHLVKHESKFATLACYQTEVDVGEGDASVDIRLAGAPLRFLWLLDLVVAGMATYLARRTLHGHQLLTPIRQTVPVLAAIPAGLIGIIAQTRHELTSVLGNWVQRAHIVLAVLAAFVGLVVLAENGWGLTSHGWALALLLWSWLLFIWMSGICWRGRPLWSHPEYRYKIDAEQTHGERYKRRRQAIITIWAALISAGVVVSLVHWYPDPKRPPMSQRKAGIVSGHTTPTPVATTTPRPSSTATSSTTSAS